MSLSENVECTSDRRKIKDDVCKLPRCKLKETLRRNYSSLSDALKNCLPDTVELMYSEGLISKPTRDSASYRAIIDEFESMMELKDNIADLKDLCQSFLSCLLTQGGPPEEAARKLAKEWKENVFNELNVDLSFDDILENKSRQIHSKYNKEVAEKMTKIVVSNESEIEQSLEKLHENFVDLEGKLIEELQEMLSLKTKQFIDIQRYLLIYLRSSAHVAHNLQSCKSVDDLIQSIDNNCLDCPVIVALAKKFTSASLYQSLQKHSDNAKAFRSSQTIENFRLELGRIYNPHLDDISKAPKAHISLNNPWDSVVIDQLYILIKCFFPTFTLSALLTRIKITKASVHILYFMAESPEQIQEILKSCKQNTFFMRCIGIYRFVINEMSILDEPKNTRYTFEFGLLMAAQDGSEKGVQFLLDLGDKVDIDFFNEETGETPLTIAAKEGHLNVIKPLIAAGANVNVQNKIGATALLIATQYMYMYNNLRLIEYLLSNKADPNVQANDGMSALILASLFGNEQIVRKLLQKNADVNAYLSTRELDHLTPYKQTPLFLAVKYNHLKVVEALFSKMYQHSDSNLHGAVMLAVDEEKIDALKLLLQAGVNPNFEIKIGSQMLKQFVDYGIPRESSTYQSLMKKSELNKDWLASPSEVIGKDDVSTMSTGTTGPLLSALMLRNDQMIDLLLQYGADPNKRYEPNGGTALVLVITRGDLKSLMKLTKYADLTLNFHFGSYLHLAISCTSENSDRVYTYIVEFLLRSNIDVNTQNNRGITPLLMATAYDNTQIVEMLLNYNPQLDICDSSGKTALILSTSFYNNLKLVDMLISKGANPDIQDKEGMTALMFGCKKNRNKIIHRLLTCSNVYLRNKSGISAFHFAAYIGNIPILETFFKDFEISEEEISWGIVLACYGGNSSVIIFLLKHITTLAKDEEDMLISCIRNNLATVMRKIFIEHFDPNTPLVYGLTALMIASSCGHSLLIHILIHAGADINAQEQFFGYHALFFAISGSLSLNSVKPLLDKQAEVNIIADNKTPLDVAELNKLPTVAALLRINGALRRESIISTTAVQEEDSNLMIEKEIDLQIDKDYDFLFSQISKMF